MSIDDDFYKYKLFGYDIMWRNGLTIAGIIACKKYRDSGVVINTGTTDWCSSVGMEGPSGKSIKKITRRMIDMLLQPSEYISNNLF